MKNKIIKIKEKKPYIFKFIICNIILISFILLSIWNFEYGIMAIFMIGAYPLFDYIMQSLISNDILFLSLYSIWVLLICNFWFYLFIKKNKGGKKKEVIALIVYLILIALIWFFWMASSIFSL